MTPLEFVRWPLESSDRDRDLADRLAVRSRAATLRWAAAVLRLPIRSRVRKALLSRMVRATNAAANRGDDEIRLLSYGPASEIRIEDPGWRAIGIEPVYRGIDGARQLLDALDGGFAELRWENREVIDAGGGRFGIRLEFLGTGRGSGIETRQQQWHVFVAERGVVLRHSVWAGEAEALAALAEP